MSYPLLEQLRRLQTQELSEGAQDFLNTITQGDVDERITNAMKAYASLNSDNAVLDEISEALFKNEIKLAANNASVVGIERGLRLGEKSGEQIVLEAREFAERFLEQAVPWLDDVEGVDDD